MKFNKNSKILIAGSTGMVGSSFLRNLHNRGFKNIIAPPRAKLDYEDKNNVFSFLEKYKPDYVICCAALVGGINANNSNKVDFLVRNLEIQNNLITQSHKANIKNLLFMGSSCIYPRDSKQPIKENYLLSGPLEKTNEAYALAKIAGLKLCEYFNKEHGRNYFSVMPTNLYGPNDNYDLEKSHVIPGLIHRFHLAKINGDQKVEVWGDGSPKREFLYVDDLIDACIFLLKQKKYINIVNIGSGEEVTIKKLANLIKKTINANFELIFNNDYPNGTPRKLLSSKIIKEIGWAPKINLERGLKKAYNNFKNFYLKTN